MQKEAKIRKSNIDLLLFIILDGGDNELCKHQLINDYPHTRGFFWNKVLHCSKFYASNFMLFHWLDCVIFFTALGLTLDFLIQGAGNAILLRQERIKE